MRLFIAAVVIAAAHAASLGADKCTWGPSYWCSSLETATTCQALTHCVDTVWKPRLLPVQQTEVCLFSQKLMETVRSVLSFDNGDTQATHLVASMCTFVKDNTARKQCKDRVTNFLPQILKLMKSSMEPSSIATVLGFCKPLDDSVNETPKQEQDPYSPPTKSTMCQDCGAFIDDIRTFINKPQAEEQLTTVIEDIVCSDLGDMVFLCKALVDSAVPKLFKFLANDDNPEMVCRLGTFCSDTESFKPKWDMIADLVKGELYDTLNDLEPDAEAWLPCSECNKVITSVTAFEKESHFRNAVEHAIGFLCSHTGLGEEKCRLLSEGLIPKELITVLTRDLNVRDLCSSTLQCSGPGLPEVAPTLASHYEVLTPDPRSFCEDCLRLFGDVRDVLRNNMTAPEATALAKQVVCPNMGPLEFLCDDKLDTVVSSILQWLAADGSPPSVCTKLTICNLKTDNLPKFDLVKLLDAAWEQKSLGDFKCDECEVLVQDARDGDRNPDVQKGIVNFFNEICDQLGQEAQQCKALVQQFAPELFEIVASELDPTVVCELLLRCTKPEYQAENDEAAPRVVPDTVDIALEPHSQPRPVKKSKKNSAVYDAQTALKQRVGESTECALCRLAMESIDKLIAANSTEQAIEKGLQEVCNILPSSIKEPCDKFIVDYTPALVELLLQQLDPNLVCDELQLCNKTESQHSLMAPVLRAAEEIQEEKERDPEVAIECETCQLVVGTVDIIIKENRTEANIQKALEDVCNILPSGIRPQCLSFVDEYSSVVVQLLVQELDPVQVCIAIGLCQQAEAVDEVSTPKVSDALCTICEIVISEVDKIIGDNKSELAVQSALEQVCSLFPDTIRAECKSFVDAYAPAIINLLVQEIQPDRICKLLGLCSESAEAEVPEPTAPSVSADPLCPLCQLVVNELANLIATNKTEVAIEQALEKVCTLLPSTARAECTSLISLYAPAIINLLMQEVKPQEVCRRLGLCSSSARVEVALPEVVNTPTDQADNVECELCKIIITEINNIIKDNRTEAALIKAVETVCDVVSGDLKLQCKSEVENYGPAVLDLLQHMDDPVEVCKAVKLCTSSTPNMSGKQKKGEVSDGDVCIICQTLANYAGEAAKEQATQDEVEKLLKDICTVLPSKLTSACNSVVDQFTPLVLQLVAEKDNPLEICQDLKLCPKEEANLHPALVGVDACTFGPAYWCANMDNARQCGVVEECVEKYGMSP